MPSIFKRLLVFGIAFLVIIPQHTFAQETVNESNLNTISFRVKMARNRNDSANAIRLYEMIVEYAKNTLDLYHGEPLFSIHMDDVEFVMQSYSRINTEIAKQKVEEYYEIYKCNSEYHYGKDPINPVNDTIVFKKSLVYYFGSVLSKAAGFYDDAISYGIDRVNYFEKYKVYDENYFHALYTLAHNYQGLLNDYYSAVLTYKKELFAIIEKYGPTDTRIKDVFTSMALCYSAGVGNMYSMCHKGLDYIIDSEFLTNISDISTLNDLWLSIITSIYQQLGATLYDDLLSNLASALAPKANFPDAFDSCSIPECLSIKALILVADSDFSGLLKFLRNDVSTSEYISSFDRTKLYVTISSLLQDNKYFSISSSVLEQRFKDSDLSCKDRELIASELLTLYHFTGDERLIKDYGTIFTEPISNGIIDIYDAGCYINALNSLFFFKEYKAQQVGEHSVEAVELAELMYNISKGSLPERFNSEINLSAVKQVVCDMAPIYKLTAATSYATLLRSIKRFDEAEELYKESIKLNDEYNLVSDATSIYLDLARLYSETQQDSLAITILNKLSESEESTYSKLDYYDALSNCYLHLGDFVSLKNCIAEWTDLSIEDYMETAKKMTRSERSTLWRMKKYDQLIINLGTICSIGGQEYNGYYYNLLLSHKGLLLKINDIIREETLASSDKDLISAYEAFKNAERQGRKDALTYERAFIRQYSLSNLQQLSYDRYKWQDVRDKLPSGSIAVEFTKSLSISKGTYVYAAMIVAPDATWPIYIELCNSDQIDNLDTDAIIGVMESGKLYESIWEPIFDVIDNVNVIYFSPYSQLCSLPLEYAESYAPGGEKQKHKYARVSTTADLPEYKKVPNYVSASLFGGFLYDEDISQEASSNYFTNISVSSLANNENLRRKGWNYLPGTLDEVEMIDSILSNKGISTHLFIGKEGTETCFKSLSGKNSDVIHVATHGFCVPGSSNELLESTGLLFTGGQKGWSGEYENNNIDDGILLAKEVSGMDLSNTDLVVLSACETALGNITNDGVYGLQMAFKIAGVHSIIMSLWDVSDSATQMMMSEFYAFIAKGMNKHDAFLEAISQVRKKFDSPYYWASFVMLD